METIMIPLANSKGGLEVLLLTGAANKNPRTR